VIQSIAADFSSLGTALQGDNAGLDVYLVCSLEWHGGKVNLVKKPYEVTEDRLLMYWSWERTGAYDTIIVASVNEEKHKISLFSVPRDLYINGRRINEYYTYYGVDQLSRMVSTVTGLQMDQYVQVDLQGFIDIVDVLGGLDVYVSESLYDGLYPNGKGGYSSYSIDEGQHHFTGEEALKYARSRHSTSDFDRAERQQTVLAALRTKVVQLDSVMEMKELTKLFQTAIENTTTDIDLLDAVGYYYDYQEYDLNTGFVLTSGNYLTSLINESGAYILIPRDGDFTEIHEVISELVN
jgi:LCP family protein required for cell wall assembly